jgi:hypothetical protein
MTLKEIIEIANEAYPSDENCVQVAFDILQDTGDTSGMTLDDVGDTLAVFIARELRDTFDPNADSEMQLDEALRVVVKARRQLEVIELSLLKHLGQVTQTQEP